MLTRIIFLLVVGAQRLQTCLEQKFILFLIPYLICLKIKVWNAYTSPFDAYTLPYRGQNAWPNISLLKPKWSMTISKLSSLSKSVLN